jgi:hypothetical protein
MLLPFCHFRIQMVLQKILKGDHIRSFRILGNTLLQVQGNNHVNPRCLHLRDLSFGYSLVNRSQEEPKSLRPFRHNLAPPLSQRSLGREDYRILSICFQLVILSEA